MHRMAGIWPGRTAAILLVVLCWLPVDSVRAQEVPDRFKGITLVDPVPEGYEFPLVFGQATPWKAGQRLQGVVVGFRAKFLPKQFTVKEIVFQNARVNGQAVELKPYITSFSTRSRDPVQLDPLAIPLAEQAVRDLMERGGGELQFNADAYVLISPTVLEMVRFGARQVVMRFTVSAALRVEEIVSEISARKLAEYYSPVVYQQTNDKRKDFITKFNFDGNWNGNDNRENQKNFPLKAYVYFSVVESKSHFFLGYFFFHPEDYVKLTGPGCGFWNKIGSHQNDLEGMQLVVEKDGTKFGNLLFMETLAHNFFYQLENSDRVKDKRERRGVLEDIDGHIELEVNDSGQHSKIYIECLGHGVWGYGQNGKDVGPKDKYVVYRLGPEAEEPEHQNDHDVSYELIDVFDPKEGLWAHREKLGEGLPERTYMAPGTFWDGFQYQRQLGAAFYSDGGVHARPPWGWKSKGTKRGDWFLAPAYSFRRHVFIPGLEGDALTYVRNPYLEDGGRNPDQTGTAIESTGTSETAKRADTGDAEKNARVVPGETRMDRPADTAILADATRILLDKGDVLENISSMADALKAGQEILLPLVSQYVNISGEDASRISFRYKNVFGLKKIHLYWKTAKMDDFDDEHSVRLNVSSRAGWHWQTVELLELESFDRMATIEKFKVSLEFDKEVFNWSGNVSEMYQLMKDLPNALDVFFGRSEYLEAEKNLQSEDGRPNR